jgi:hypothetical protein
MAKLVFQVYELRRVKMEYTVEADTKEKGWLLAEIGSTIHEVADGESEVISREVADFLYTEEE